MARNILLTGASGYLGGTLLARLKDAKLPAYGTLFALVRSDVQAEAVKAYGATPLTIGLQDDEAVRQAVVDNNISVVFWLIEAASAVVQRKFIKALAEVKAKTGKEVHLLHTTGAKLFSSHAAAPTDQPLLDNDPKLYDIQKAQVDRAAPGIAMMKNGVVANNEVIEQGEGHGVRTYIFAPCIVYGKGEGFGNLISIQTVAIVQAAKATRRIYKVDEEKPTWPVCHIVDNTNLYLALLSSILGEKNPGHGKNGYYLASPGSVAWDDLYEAMGKALKQRGVVDDDAIQQADDPAIEAMSSVFGCSKEFVPVILGGNCTFTAVHGKDLSWKPLYAPEHILEYADAEVGFILQNLKD